MPLPCVVDGQALYMCVCTSNSPVLVSSSPLGLAIPALFGFVVLGLVRSTIGSWRCTGCVFLCFFCHVGGEVGASL